MPETYSRASGPTSQNCPLYFGAFPHVYAAEFVLSGTGVCSPMTCSGVGWLYQEREVSSVIWLGSNGTGVVLGYSITPLGSVNGMLLVPLFVVGFWKAPIEMKLPVPEPRAASVPALAVK